MENRECAAEIITGRRRVYMAVFCLVLPINTNCVDGNNKLRPVKNRAQQFESTSSAPAIMRAACYPQLQETKMKMHNVTGSHSQLPDIKERVAVGRATEGYR